MGLVPAVGWQGPLVSRLLKLFSALPHPPSAEHDVGGDASGVLLSPLLQCVKDEPEICKYWSAPLHRAAQPRLQPKPCQHDGNGGLRGSGDPSRVPQQACLPMGVLGLLSRSLVSKPAPEREGMGMAGMGRPDPA